MAINMHAAKNSIRKIFGRDRRSALKAAKILAAVAVFLIVFIALGFGIYDNIQQLMNRPGTATQEARKAIEAHDLAAFGKYVDTDAIIEQAAEQILSEQINSSIDAMTYSTDAIQTRYENELKPDFVQSARAALEKYIATGAVTYPATLTEAQRFLKESGADTCEIKSLTKPHREGNAQYSKVIFYNPKMKFSFELELELRESPEGTWQVTDVKGFDDYYAAYRRALRRKLDSLNTPIIGQMEEIFLLKSFRIQGGDGDEYGFSKNLDIELKADVKSDKPLSKVIGVVRIGKDERERVTPFEIDMTDRPQGLQTFRVTKTLNPFVRADVDAMKHGFRKCDVHIAVMEIIFADGTNLKQLDHLPE